MHCKYLTTSRDKTKKNSMSLDRPTANGYNIPDVAGVAE